MPKLGGKFRPRHWLLTVFVSLSLWGAGVARASPPPDDYDELELSSVPWAIAGTLLVLGLLGLASVAGGHLLARRRPGRLFLAIALLGSLGLCVGALWTGPSIFLDRWRVVLHVLALALTTFSMAAWVRGDGPSRGPVRGALVLSCIAALGAVVVWGDVIVGAARAPLLRLNKKPRDCGAESLWSPAREDWGWHHDDRVAPRPRQGERVVANIQNGRPFVELELVQDRPSGGLRTLSTRRLTFDGWWVGLAADRRGVAYAAWSSPDERSVTVVELREDLTVARKRSFRVPLRRDQPSLTAREHVCLDWYVWRHHTRNHDVLVLTPSLGLATGVAGLGPALSGTETIPAWIAVFASALLVLWILLGWQQLRSRRRAPRDEGRLDEDGRSLIVKDGSRVLVDATPAVTRGWKPGETYTVLGGRRSASTTGPYREGAVVTRPSAILPGAWAEAEAALLAHFGRFALAAASVIAILSVTALELLLHP